jgi:hypothetical protein
MNPVDAPAPYHYVTPSEESRYPHLILHFDINRTLVAFDGIQQKGESDIVIKTLAEQVEALWDDTLTHPISYADYIYYHLLPNPKRSAKIKAEQRDQVYRFIETLKETDHPLYPEVERRFEEAMASLKSHSTLIFPSFYKLVDFLKEERISYTLVLRTFGGDAKALATELNDRLHGPFLVDISSYAEHHFESQEEFYYYLKDAGHHLALTDNWRDWLAHGEEWMHGKPFPINPNDKTVLSLFFDDHARLSLEHPQKNAIAPYDLSQGQIHPEEAIRRSCLFPVDTLEALSNENYYVELVQKALAVFSSVK